MKTNALEWPASKKRPNVRSFKEIDILRASLQALSHIAPGAAARWASKMFLTPPPPRPLSSKARAVFDSAADSFAVPLETTIGGVAESARVHVTLWGRGPAVYMLHGWGGRGSQWTSFVEPLVQAGFIAAVLDAPGHGDTPAPRTSILHFAAALRAVVDDVGPAHAIIGHSLGGAATSLALRQGLRADKAVLVGAPADPATFFGEFLGRLGIPARLHASIRSDVERRYGFSWSDLAVSGPRGDAAAPAAAALIVHDAGDAEVDHGDARRIAAAWPNAEVLTTRGLGHQRILRDEEVVRRVVTWLSKPGSPVAGETPTVLR